MVERKKSRNVYIWKQKTVFFLQKQYTEPNKCAMIWAVPCRLTC